MWPDAIILVFWMLSFKPTFSLSSFIFIQQTFIEHFLHAKYILDIGDKLVNYIDPTSFMNLKVEQTK